MNRKLAVRRLVMILVGGAAIVTLGAPLALRPPPDALAADIPLVRPLPPGPLGIVAFGTSLTAPPQIWPDALTERLSACRGTPVTLTRVAGIGMGSPWALTQLDRVVAARPDLVLIEFAINDADLRDGVWPAGGRDRHRALVETLQARLPEARIVLMSMSPAHGPRGWIRPLLVRHYADYAGLARDHDLGFVNLYARWQGLSHADQGLDADGLHPDPGWAAAVIVPALSAYLGYPDQQDRGTALCR